MSAADWLKRPAYQQSIALVEAKKCDTKEYEIANLKAKLIEPIRASIASILTHPYVSLVGNRVQLLCTAAITSFLAIFVEKDIAEGDMMKIVIKTIAAAILLVLTNTAIGSWTAYTYARTKELMATKEKLPDGFIQKGIGTTYCTAQGVYLALKDDKEALAKLKEILDRDHPILKWILK